MSEKKIKLIEPVVGEVEQAADVLTSVVREWCAA